MKKITLASLLVLAGMGLFTQSAHALTYTEGDLFIGFYDSAAPGQDYLVDVGQASLYTKNNGSQFTLSSIGATGTNLSTVFTADGGAGGWYTNTNTIWGVFGGPTATDLGNTLYAGTAENPIGTAGPIPASPDTNINQGGYLTGMNAIANYYETNGTSISSSPATYQVTSASSSYEAKVTSTGEAFNDFSNFGGNINQDGNGDNIGNALDLYQVIPKGQTGFANGADILEGTFTINSSGTITYQTAGAVPEPSTWTALAGGAALLCLIRRRRTVAA